MRSITNKKTLNTPSFSKANTSLSPTSSNTTTTAQLKKQQHYADNSSQVQQLHAMQLKSDQSPTNKKLTQLQKQADNATTTQAQANNTGLPNQLKSGIENLSGYSMDDVKVHRNSDKPAQLQAHAYAQGTDIHLGPGQEKHLAHEAWHVVQQKQGRVQPTKQMKGKVNINDNQGLEKEADVMGAKAAQLTATSFYANTANDAVALDNGNTAQLVTIQREEKDDNGKVAKLHVHADLDAPGMALIDQLTSGNVGHAWISIEWIDKDNVPADISAPHRNLLARGGTQANPIGFWPKMFGAYDQVTESWATLPPGERVGYSSNPFNSYVAGQVVQPDNLHSPKATQSYDITHDQAKAVMNYADSKHGAQYSVFYYNCTTFAKEAAQAGGVNPPRMGILGICYPDKLYKSIVKNHNKKKGTTTVAGTTVEGGSERKKN